MTNTQTIATPILTTERLLLRAPEMSDAPMIALYGGDLRVSRHLAVVPHPYPPGAAESFLKSLQRNAGDILTWAITLNAGEQEELIGIISLDRKPDHHALGYWLAPQLWGGGFMSEAVQRVVTYGQDAGIAEIRANVHQDNPASAKVLAKGGFDYLGDGEQFALALGRCVPTWQYRLVLDNP